jgi:hypothetical protein
MIDSQILHITLHLRGDDHDGIVTHGRSREFRMHMKNTAQTGSGCLSFNDIKVENALSNTDNCSNADYRNMLNSKLLTFDF